MSSNGLTTGEKIVLIGGGLAIVGAVLPWASVAEGSVTGIGAERGIVTLLCGIAAIGIIYARDWAQTEQLTTGLLGAAITVISAVTLADPSVIAGGASGLWAAGIGLYLSTFAGILTLLGAGYGYTNTSSETGLYSQRR